MTKKIALLIQLVKLKIDFECLRRRIIRYEKFSPRPYWDKCHFTIGYGTTMTCAQWGKWVKHPFKYTITKEEAAKELDRYINMAIRQLVKLLGDNIEKCNHVQIEALIDMIFNMGISRFRQFKNMLLALNEPIVSWGKVALHCMNSQYYKNPNKIKREENVVQELRTGTYAETY
jgi:GH24 family phage-related lysozyme (muramidase)